MRHLKPLRLLSLAIVAMAGVSAAHGDDIIYTGNGSNVEKYDVTTSTLLDSVTSASGFTPESVQVYDGVVYVSSVDAATNNIVISTYNAGTLATENASFASYSGSFEGDTTDLTSTGQMAADNGNIYVISNQSYGASTNVEQINATTGASTALITYTGDVGVGLIATGGNIYTAGYISSAVQEWNESTGAFEPGTAGYGNFIDVGASINAYEDAGNMVADGNTLFVQDIDNETIGAYNLTTGAVLNEFFIDPVYWNGVNNDAGSVDLLGMTLIGDTLYENYGNGDLDAYNATTGALEATLAEVGSTTDFTADEGSGFVNPPPGAGGTLPIAYLPPGSTPEPASFGLALAVLAVVSFLRWGKGLTAGEARPDMA